MTQARASTRTIAATFGKPFASRTEMGIQDILKDAQACHLERRLALAEARYRQVLALDSRSVPALEGLGMVVFQQGRAAEAVTLFGRGVDLAPGSARLHANLGEALRTCGELEKAREHLEKAATVAPGLAQTWNSLGLLASDQGRHADAETLFRHAMRLRPELTAACINLANALHNQGRTGEAIAALRAVIVTEPENVLALTNLGQMLCETGAGNVDEAVALCRRAVQLRPELPGPLAGLGKVLRISAEAHLGMGRVLLEEGRLSEAESAIRHALGLDPSLAPAWTAIARLQAERGEFELSCQSARQALACRPETAEAYWWLAVNLTGRLADLEVESLERLTRRSDLPADTRAILHFSLALVRDGCGLYSEAAALFDTGHAIQSAWRTARGQIYDAAKQSRYIDRMIAAFPSGIFDGKREWGESDARPVFVVGLPRTGTTLVQQILAAHPAVYAAGELTDLHGVFRELPQLVGRSEAQAIEALADLDQLATQKLARLYLERAIALAPDGVARVVDKMPDNVRLLGLIGLILPKARVILCTRDLRDVAVSCRQAGFTANVWTDDWNHTAQHFADYQRLLEHWRLVRPVEWLEISYEECVRNVGARRAS